MRVKMTPHWKDVGLNNGIGQVIYNYHRWMPEVGIELVDEDEDVCVSHLGTAANCDVHHNHGLWLGKELNGLQMGQNRVIINSALTAGAVVVPSNYVANYFKRDMRISPFVVGHGVNCDEWQPSINRRYVLWNKNRMGDVCDPQSVTELALRFPQIDFLTTFSKTPLRNVYETGPLKFEKMKQFIQSASIYLATTPETFGIGTLEAMASGVPVLGFRFGGTADIVSHLEDGYLVEPNDYESLAHGLAWVFSNRDKLSKAARAKAETYSWLNVVKQLKEIYASQCHNHVL